MLQNSETKNKEERHGVPSSSVEGGYEKYQSNQRVNASSSSKESGGAGLTEIEMEV